MSAAKLAATPNHSCRCNQRPLGPTNRPISTRKRRDRASEMPTEITYAVRIHAFLRQWGAWPAADLAVLAVMPQLCPLSSPSASCFPASAAASAPAPPPRLAAHCDVQQTATEATSYYTYYVHTGQQQQRQQQQQQSARRGLLPSA
jgi:hypothetical protein